MYDFIARRLGNEVYQLVITYSMPFLATFPCTNNMKKQVEHVRTEAMTIV